MADENLRLRAALRDLVALSTIPAGWIGIAPRTIAAGLADILAGSLGFDFAFVRLLDPAGGATIDVASGCHQGIPGLAAGPILYVRWVFAEADHS